MSTLLGMWKARGCLWALLKRPHGRAWIFQRRRLEFSSSGERTVRCLDMWVNTGLVPEAMVSQAAGDWWLVTTKRKMFAQSCSSWGCLSGYGIPDPCIGCSCVWLGLSLINNIMWCQTDSWVLARHFYSNYLKTWVCPFDGNQQLLCLSLQGPYPCHQTSPGALLPTGLHHVKDLGVNLK